MDLHVLSGDSLDAPFRKLGIEGDVAIFRECFVDGPVAVDPLEEFLAVREAYLNSQYPRNDSFYRDRVRPEIEKVLNAKDGKEIILWFEHELFCQVNLWFLLSRLRDRPLKISAVLPSVSSESDRFKGWAVMDAHELRRCFDNRVTVKRADVELGAALWGAFASMDHGRLVDLSSESSDIFQYLGEVAIAASENDTRPIAAIRAIIESGAESFAEVFCEFGRCEPVFGFGDLQLKRIYDEVLKGQGEREKGKG